MVRKSAALAKETKAERKRERERERERAFGDTARQQDHS
jgi:hypothetical protein